MMLGIVVLAMMSITVVGANTAVTNDNNSAKTLPSWAIPADSFPDGKILNQSYYNSTLNAYVDPVLKQVSDMRAKGKDDASIVAELKKQNITYFPKTNDWARGTPISVDPRSFDLDPFNKSSGFTSNSVTSQAAISPAIGVPDVEIYTVHQTNNYAYSGFDCVMIPNNMAVASGGTKVNYWTTHVGTSKYDFAEIGMERTLTTDGIRLYTFDVKTDYVNGVMNIYDLGKVSEGQNVDTVIEVMNQHDSNGYVYWVLVNSNIVRSGHLNTLSGNQVFQNKEAYMAGTSAGYTNEDTWCKANAQILFHYSGTQMFSDMWLESSVPTTDNNNWNTKMKMQTYTYRSCTEDDAYVYN
ncbi:MAG TPA: hypothetical protein VK436_12450 [Methanocella sp.]|nr:hypothetical protein [Methanocella sp.]